MMRMCVAGFLTLVVSVALHFVVPKMKMKYMGYGTELPKSGELLIALSDTFVNYFYVLIPLLFFMFQFFVGFFIPEPERKDN